MNKILLLILVNIGILLLFYVCGVIAGASFNIFDWSEGLRMVISLFYGSTALTTNAVIGIEYKT